MYTSFGLRNYSYCWKLAAGPQEITHLRKHSQCQELELDQDAYTIKGKIEDVRLVTFNLGYDGLQKWFHVLKISMLLIGLLFCRIKKSHTL
jgi:hypothetical protein